MNPTLIIFNFVCCVHDKDTGMSKNLKAIILDCDSILIAVKSVVCMHWQFIGLSNEKAGARIIL
jgi:hypothetical protein